MAETGDQNLDYAVRLNPLGPMDVDTVSADRQSRLIASVALAFVSRAAALAVQLIALPIALAVLGTASYAAFLSLQASFGWFGLAGFGLTIILPRFLASAAVTGNQREQRQLILTSLVTMAAMGLLVTLAALLVGAVVSPGALFNVPAGVDRRDMSIAFVVAAAFFGGRFLVSVVPAVRSGYQELHRIYIMTAAANLLVIVLIVRVFPHDGHIASLFAYMYGPIVLLLTVDFLLLLYSRRYLAAGPWQFVATLKTLLPVSLNALLKQVSYFLMSSGAIVAVLHWASTTNIAAFGSLMALLMLGGSGFSALYQPLLAAMANAHSHSDKRWFRRAYFGGLAVVLGVTGVLCLIALASGPQLATLWLNADLGISRTLCVAMAVYFLFWMLSEYHFLVLASMAKLTGLGKIYVFEGISALSLGSILAHFDGIEGMAIGLAIGTAIFSLFYLPLRAWRIVAREGWSA